MRTIPITGSDVTTIRPMNGVIHVAGIIRKHDQLIDINWEVDGRSGSTQCQAWYGQYEIDQLTKAGYKIIGVSLV